MGGNPPLRYDASERALGLIIGDDQRGHDVHREQVRRSCWTWMLGTEAPTIQNSETLR
jgi:hypothetical protein